MAKNRAPHVRKNLLYTAVSRILIIFYAYGYPPLFYFWGQPKLKLQFLERQRTKSPAFKRRRLYLLGFKRNARTGNSKPHGPMFGFVTTIDINKTQFTIYQQVNDLERRLKQ